MLAADDRMKLAVRYAKAFRGLDPIALLRDWDYHAGMQREAAFIVHQRDEEERAAREKAQARRKR